jgi:hypothetical protein
MPFIITNVHNLRLHLYVIVTKLGNLFSKTFVVYGQIHGVVCPLNRLYVPLFHGQNTHHFFSYNPQDNLHPNMAEF